MTAKKVLVFGETLWDLLPGGPQLGGAPCNFACRIHELGNSTILATRLGRDDLGQQAAERLAELGLETSFLQRDDARPTGTVTVEVDKQGVPDFTILPDVAYDFIEVTPDLRSAAATADAFCFGTLAQRAPTSRETLARLLDESPGFKILDLNLRKDCHSNETIMGSLERANLLKLNEDEAGVLAQLFRFADPAIPSFCDSILKRFPLSHVVVTLGERGAFAATTNGVRAYAPGHRVKLVDTCGSGDAFTAGFVHELLQEQPLVACLERGNLLGALVATQPGATTPIPKNAPHPPNSVSDPALARFRPV